MFFCGGEFLRCLFLYKLLTIIGNTGDGSTCYAKSEKTGRWLISASCFFVTLIILSAGYREKNFYFIHNVMFSLDTFTKILYNIKLTVYVT